MHGIVVLLDDRKDHIRILVRNIERHIRIADGSGITRIVLKCKIVRYGIVGIGFGSISYPFRQDHAIDTGRRDLDGDSRTFLRRKHDVTRFIIGQFISELEHAELGISILERRPLESYGTETGCRGVFVPPYGNARLGHAAFRYRRTFLDCSNPITVDNVPFDTFLHRDFYFFGSGRARAHCKQLVYNEHIARL